MTQENNSIKISEETQIDLPATRRCMVIERRDWERIRKMIGQIKDNYNRWENSAWACLSFASALFLTRFSIADISLKTNFLIVAIASLVVGFVLFFVSYFISKTLSKSKEDVLLEMNDVEKNIKPSNTYFTTDKLEIISATYGTTEKVFDVTKNLSDLITEDRLGIVASNNIAGDPHPGVIKDLKIQYKYQGQEHTRAVKEGQELIIP